jgi:hypothetical protein
MVLDTLISQMGQKIIPSKRSPTVKPSSCPKLFDTILVIQIAKTMFTPGINISSSHHHGLPQI